MDYNQVINSARRIIRLAEENLREYEESRKDAFASGRRRQGEQAIAEAMVEMLAGVAGFTHNPSDGLTSMVVLAKEKCRGRFPLRYECPEVPDTIRFNGLQGRFNPERD